ncbi:hypothetical protein WUBG_06541 [Wuchereria bancrofti]|uniref:Uncharacterized protein n=1 Tax=Wuchereria bancrofti TaxID=6293 RepID=J9EJF6_WUCBA|nr:hypothetical protein WUBG_06541 [Wuchereria bancrofti]
MGQNDMPIPNSIQLLILFGQQLKRREKEVHCQLTAIIFRSLPQHTAHFELKGKPPSFLEINHAESAITADCFFSPPLLFEQHADKSSAADRCHVACTRYTIYCI